MAVCFPMPCAQVHAHAVPAMHVASHADTKFRKGSLGTALSSIEI